MDVLETWCGMWFTEQQIVAHVERIRPDVAAVSVERKLEKVRKAGGATVGGRWIPVEWKPAEPDPFSTSTYNLGCVMRVAHRVF